VKILRPLHVLSLVARIAALSLLSLAGAASWGVLGGDVAGIQADQTRMRATRLSTDTAQGGSVHEIRMPDGSSIRQFVNAQGIVYAVAWSTRLKPDFAQLLGRHAADFDAGVSAVAQTPGIKRSAVVDRGDLVVVSAGRPGAFVGRAWLKSQLPQGTGSDAIR
jgi:Protein of unknown function (DUF2844)